MGHLTRGPIAVNHSKGSGANIRELMKHVRGNVNRLTRVDDLPLASKTHLALTLQNKVDFFLILVVPWYLAAIGIQANVTEGEA